MHDILHDVTIAAEPTRVFEALVTPDGLDAWWTLSSSGEPAPDAPYRFFFGPDYDWRGRVRRIRPGKVIEWEITRADRDWTGTFIGIELEERNGSTWLRFRHVGWTEANAHFRQSSYCWALYLRHLKRYVEAGRVVPYPDRYSD